MRQCYFEEVIKVLSLVSVNVLIKTSKGLVLGIGYVSYFFQLDFSFSQKKKMQKHTGVPFQIRKLMFAFDPMASH